MNLHNMYTNRMMIEQTKLGSRKEANSARQKSKRHMIAFLKPCEDSCPVQGSLFLACRHSRKGVRNQLLWSLGGPNSPKLSRARVKLLFQELFWQTKPKKVRFANFPGRSPEVVLEPPFFRGSVKHLQPTGGSGTSSGLPSGKLANLTFFGLVCRNPS